MNGFSEEEDAVGIEHNGALSQKEQEQMGRQAMIETAEDLEARAETIRFMLREMGGAGCSGGLSPRACYEIMQELVSGIVQK